MQVDIKIDAGATIPYALIFTSSITAEVEQAVRRLNDMGEGRLPGYREGEVLLLTAKDIWRVYTEGQKIMAEGREGKVQLHGRLYEWEERLVPDGFFRISHSEVVNLQAVKSLDLSLAGTVGLKFKSGGSTFVSRRYVDKLKKRLGL